MSPSMNHPMLRPSMVLMMATPPYNLIVMQFPILPLLPCQPPHPAILAMTWWLSLSSLIPLLGGLSQKWQYSESPSSDQSHKCLCFELPCSSTSQNLMTPKRSHHYVPLTPKHLHHGFSTSPLSAEISSPLHAIHSPQPVAMVPAPGFELHVCLHDFAEAKGIDMTKFEIPLSMEEYVGIIPSMLVCARTFYPDLVILDRNNYLIWKLCSTF